jgi:uncharacterized protein
MSAPFLGTGWGFPPTFSRQELGVEMVSGERDIRESLRILLSTELGERLMVPAYGCQLRELLFQPLTRSLITEIQTRVKRAILAWEPRITVEDIRVKVDASAPGLVSLLIDYSVKLTNSRNNFVYPFYTIEATLRPPGP